jgi:hypothetical protein
MRYRSAIGIVKRIDFAMKFPATFCNSRLMLEYGYPGKLPPFLQQLRAPDATLMQ